MKKTIITYFLAACTFFIATSQKRSSSYSSSENGVHSIVINDDNNSLEIKYTGDISFNDDETAIKTISSDGYLKFKKNGKKIIVTDKDNGEIMYEINDADKKSTLNDDEKSFLAEAIKMMIEYGVGAKNRVERIYKKGGSKAVMGEVKNMKSDYVKSIYLEYLLETNSLSTTEMTEIADNVHFLLQSDFEKGKLLKKFSSKYLANAATAQAYLGAVKSINSDFEKANAVKSILNQTLTKEQFTEVLEVTNSINSDFEKANVLKEVLANNKIAPAQFSEVLNATSHIHSDFEKANVLKQLAGSGIKEEAHWISLISSTEKVSSDFEKGNVLRDIAERMPNTDNVKSAYMKAAKTISSDFEYGKVIRSIKEAN